MSRKTAVVFGVVLAVGISCFGCKSKPGEDDGKRASKPGEDDGKRAILDKEDSSSNEFQDCLDAAFLSYSQNNDFKSAIAYYDKALALRPDYGNAYHNRGCLYIHVGEVDRGIADLDKAIQIAPNDAMAYANRGIAYRKKGEAQKAEADFQKAVSLDAKVGTSSVALHMSDVSRVMKFKVVDGKFVKE